ncbi:MAG: hypothetical protein H6747_03030 [Deltaproteobacteria bacterium]|nr:hypothetical protein [Deltaproteobacteria bacterium]
MSRPLFSSVHRPTLFAAAAVALLAAAGCSTEPGSGGTTDTAGASDGAGALDSTGDTTAADVASTDTGATDTGSADTATQDVVAQDVGPAAPTFGDVWTQVLVTEGCSGQYCHGGLWPNQDAAYKHLTTATIKTPKCASTSYVVPGDPNKSLLWLKIDPAAKHGCGNKMPTGKAGVSAASSQLVKDWITAGAKP